MALQTKAIKRRLKSIKNIGKITKAMELVSAAKMRRAVDAALSTRTYALLAQELLSKLSKSVKGELALLEEREVKKALVVIITSNRGLCGSFNSNVIKKTAKLMEKMGVFGSNVEVDVIGLGKKGVDFAKKNNYRLIASFDNLGDVPSLDTLSPLTRMIVSEYENKVYDKVVIAYTDFRSSLSQVAVLRQLLPISEKDLEEMINTIGDKVENKEKTEEIEIDDYLFEPNKKEVLQILLPRLVSMQVYQSVLESAASEHSARMVAMKSANEAAGEMMNNLQLSFNKARQAGITQEIAEIAGGAAALE